MKIVDKLKTWNFENLSDYINYKLSMEELRLISFHLKRFLKENDYNPKERFEILINIITIDHLEQFPIDQHFFDMLISLLNSDYLDVDEFKITRIIKTILDYDRELVSDELIVRILKTQKIENLDFIHYVRVDELLYNESYKEALEYIEENESEFKSVFERIDLLETKVELLYHFGNKGKAQLLIKEVIELSKLIQDEDKQVVIEYRLKLTEVYLSSDYDKLDIDLVIDLLEDVVSRCGIASNITEQLLSYLVFNYEHYSDMSSISRIVSLYFREVRNSQNFLFYSLKHRFTMVLSYRIGDLSDVPKIIFSFRGLLDFSRIDEKIRKVAYQGDSSILEQPDGYIDKKYYKIFADSITESRIIVDA